MASCKDTLLHLTLLGTLCLVTSDPQGSSAPNPRVQIKQGWLEGLRLTVKGTNRTVSGFLGVPFAKPPVGSRRFAQPEPPEPWTGVRNATSNPPMCPQMRTEDRMIEDLFKTRIPAAPVSEDCLYLNLYTPSHASRTSRLPVMLWIHGGGFKIGSASSFDGSVIAAYEDVVLVTLQYRLGALGFLSTADEQAPGNWGFLDQVRCMEWVKENIKDFGGDPNSVTIFGESAGGMSTSAHLLSPLSKGLFHRAISQSGVLAAVIDDKNIIRSIAQMIANKSGCYSTDSASIVACLREKPEAHFLDLQTRQRITFVPPVVDGYFLEGSPEKLLNAKKMNPLPHLLGCNNNEFGWILPRLMNLTDLQNGLDKENVDVVMKAFGGLLGAEPGLFHLLKKEYLDDARNSSERRDNFLQMVGDSMFVVPTVERARCHRDAGLPTYLYEFRHPPSFLHGSRPSYVKADHTDDVFFVSGTAFRDGPSPIRINFTEEEKTLSKTMMKQWANFARSGSPNGDGLPEWPLYDGEEKYLALDLEPEVGAKLKDRRVDFWTQTLPKMKAEGQKQRKGA
ncbi:fatty acyl-CoA hydrolase precursor, medium chain-like [Lissotriton helveticus]